MVNNLITANPSLREFVTVLVMMVSGFIQLIVWVTMTEKFVNRTGPTLKEWLISLIPFAWVVLFFYVKSNVLTK